MARPGPRGARARDHHDLALTGSRLRLLGGSGRLVDVGVDGSGEPGLGTTGTPGCAGTGSPRTGEGSRLRLLGGSGRLVDVGVDMSGEPGLGTTGTPGCAGTGSPRTGKGSRLSIQAPSSWAVEGGQGQIVVRCDRERSRKLTLWLRSRGACDRNGQGVDGEYPDDEEGQNTFGEHDDVECREEEQIATAPGLKFGR